MRFSIGIFSAEGSLASIQAADEVMSAACDITYLPYTTLNHLAASYVQNIHLFDGILFSGRFPYEYIRHHFGPIQKPYSYLEATDRDYYEVFAKILYRNPGLRISRVLIEEPIIGFDFCKIFDDERPQSIAYAFTDLNQITAMYDTVFNESLRRWRRGEIDLVVTRMRNLVQPLMEAGIPTETLFPSNVSILETFRNLCHKIQSQRLSNTMSVYGVIAHTDEAWLENSKRREELQRNMEQFNENNASALIIRKMDHTFELITSNETLLDITQNYTDCLLTRFLHKNVDNALYLGWGVASDIVQAQKNARVALRHAGRSAQHAAFLVDESGELVGPLLMGKSISISETPDESVVSLGKRVGISTKNLQKLISIQDKRNMSRFTSSDLALYLNITQRSANRLLTKLLALGAARQIQSVQTYVKGRPYMMYEVDYHKLCSHAGEYKLPETRCDAIHEE